MRATEFLNESELVQEIERLRKSGYEGGKEELTDLSTAKVIKPLPGKSGLLYSINGRHEDFEIKLWDPINKGEFQPTPEPVKQSWHNRREHEARVNLWRERNDKKRRAFNRAPGKLVGQLIVSKPYNLPLKNALQVHTITTDEDYRGMGLGTALYGIVLTILKRPLVAGSSQTPNGRAAWVRLNRIPGVQMKGYMSIDDADLKTMAMSKIDNSQDKNYISWQNKQVEKRIDIIMGQLGGQYIGKDGLRRFFAFDVKPNTSETELESYIKTNFTNVYDSGRNGIGLFAVWTGKRYR